jgi:adenylate cyclase
MTVTLEDLRDCFEGVIPSVIATQDAAGAPNVSYLSQVWYVDSEHIALSNQFFSKTSANVAATGRARLMLVDGRAGHQYLLDLAFAARQETGELFERTAAQLQAAASHHGMGGVMKLRSADIYRVLECRAVPSAAAADALASELPTGGRDLASAARLAAAIASLGDAEAMLDCALDGMVDAMDLAHVMVLWPDATGRRLVTLGSRGYPAGGAGSEVPLGEGAIGIAGQSGRPVRLSDLSRARRFTTAVRTVADLEEARTIPLPGLAEPMSQLAAPMVANGQVRGVLFAESEARFRFTHEHEDALSLIGAQLAASLRLAELEAAAAGATTASAQPAATGERDYRVRYYAFDDSLFIDDAYVIKGVPGRLLFHFLKAYLDEGRREFSNREVRLDPSLRLPDLKDNLETRLILLKRRLDERGTPVRLLRPGRGLIRLEVEGSPRLETV